LLSPEREDPFLVPRDRPHQNANKDSKNILGVKRTYKDIMDDQRIDNERIDIMRKIQKNQEN
jgi:hypothetical protein